MKKNVLLNQIIASVKTEKELTAKIISYLVQVANENLYAAWGHPSLHSFCVKQLKYSDQEAALRCNAVKLIRKIPLVEEKMIKGKISLTQASDLGRFAQREEKSKDELFQIIEKVEGKSTRQTISFLEEVSEKHETSKLIKLNERLLKKLRKIQEEFDDCSELEAIEALIDRHEKPVARRRLRPSKNQRYIPQQIKRLIREKADYQCQHPCCNSRIHLEIALSHKAANPIERICSCSVGPITNCGPWDRNMVCSPKVALEVVNFWSLFSN